MDFWNRIATHSVFYRSMVDVVFFRAAFFVAPRLFYIVLLSLVARCSSLRRPDSRALQFGFTVGWFSLFPHSFARPRLFGVPGALLLSEMPGLSGAPIPFLGALGSLFWSPHVGLSSMSWAGVETCRTDCYASKMSSQRRATATGPSRPLYSGGGDVGGTGH